MTVVVLPAQLRDAMAVLAGVADVLDKGGDWQGVAEVVGGHNYSEDITDWWQVSCLLAAIGAQTLREYASVQGSSWDAYVLAALDLAATMETNAET